MLNLFGKISQGKNYCGIIWNETVPAVNNASTDFPEGAWSCEEIAYRRVENNRGYSFV